MLLVLLFGAAMTAPKLPAAGWLWPIPSVVVNGIRYQPVISSGFGTPRPGQTHRGVDLDYRRRSTTDLVKEFPPGTAGGSPMHFCPKGVPVLAARDGVVWSCGTTERGGSVVISHENPVEGGKPFATYYTHMSSLVLPKHAHGVSVATGAPTTVKAGEVLGVVGGDPMEASHFRHLHFAIWYGGTDESAIDPADAMKSWPVLAWGPPKKGA